MGFCLASFTEQVFPVYLGYSMYQYLIPSWLNNTPLYAETTFYSFVDGRFHRLDVASNASSIGMSIRLCLISFRYIPRVELLGHIW